jgi:hypothetical protein
MRVFKDRVCRAPTPTPRVYFTVAEKEKTIVRYIGGPDTAQLAKAYVYTEGGYESNIPPLERCCKP